MFLCKLRRFLVEPSLYMLLGLFPCGLFTLILSTHFIFFLSLLSPFSFSLILSLSSPTHLPSSHIPPPHHSQPHHTTSSPSNLPSLCCANATPSSALKPAIPASPQCCSVKRSQTRRPCTVRPTLGLSLPPPSLPPPFLV